MPEGPQTGGANPASREVARAAQKRGLEHSADIADANGNYDRADALREEANGMSDS